LALKKEDDQMAQSDATTADEGMQAYFDDSGFGVSGEDQQRKAKPVGPPQCCDSGQSCADGSSSV
jgi:hypothetical protein